MTYEESNLLKYAFKYMEPPRPPAAHGYPEDYKDDYKDYLYELRRYNKVRDSINYAISKSR